MPTATVSMVYCVQQATGTDTAVNEAIAQLPEMLLPEQLTGISAIAAIRTLPGVIAAVDTARADPDDLYITTDTSGGRRNAVWPAPGSDVRMQAGQSATPDIALEFDHSQNVSLWDYDSASDDDLLGSVTMFAHESGRGEIVKLAKSSVENAYYYVAYRVD